MKKLIIGLLFLALFLGVVGYDLGWAPLAPLDVDRSCPFCKPEQLSKQMVYKGDKIMVLINYKPVGEGHLLIVPKRNIQRFEELSAEELGEMGAVVAKMQRALNIAFNKPDYVLIVQNGQFGGQTVNHMHMHMIPRGEESTLAMKAQLWVMMMTQVVQNRRPLSDEEMKIEVEKIKHAIDSETENK